MSEKTFHVSLYVAEIGPAVQSYRQILGIEPAKVYADYAKFELADPPLILSLNLGGEPGTVAHLGIRHAAPDAVRQELGRAQSLGLEILEEPGTTCCYARSDKYWVRDVAGMPWEIYAVTADADVHSLPPMRPAALAPPVVAVEPCC
jgi:hypothetical protein